MFNQETVEALALPKMPIQLYNSETRKKEVFHPLHDQHVRMYTCGPTVYHFAHIGNFRTYVFEDILRRFIKFSGYQVTQVMNLTDVDDKTIKGAVESKKSLLDFTQPYKNAFFVDLQALGIERVEHYPAATDYIPQMIDFIQKLIDKGIAYTSKDKSVYYSIDKCPSYGRLSHLKLEDLKVGVSDARVACDEYEKENLSDFVLWKYYDAERDGHVYWDSPFGPGRPGWHLECSTMAMSILGETIDLHAGAVDNIFPHHENEIAQSESCSGKTFVRHWVHSEHLIVNHKKMSKSLGNFYTLRDLLQKGYTGMEVRYMLMHIHYRTQLNFTFEGLEGARNSLARLNDFIGRMQELASPSLATTEVARACIKKAMHQFCEAMADDLNISVALAACFDLMHEINILVAGQKMGPGDAMEVLYILEQFNRVLGVLNFEQEQQAPPELQKKLEKRELARKEKNWAISDQMRNEIHLAGYVIEDTPQGARLKKK